MSDHLSPPALLQTAVNEQVNIYVRSCPNFTKDVDTEADVEADAGLKLDLCSHKCY